MARLLCAALGAAFLSVAAQQSVAEEAQAGAVNADTAHAEAFDILRSGGNVLVMRHASSPHHQTAAVGLSAGCDLAEGRGLDAKGLFQARAMGAFLKAEDIPVLSAYASRMCRAWDTAALAAGGAPVIPSDAQMTTESAAISKFKKQIEAELAANPGQNIILASHSNIAPLYGAAAHDGEEEIPEGAVFVVRPPVWRSVMRIELNVEVGPQTVTVE